MSQLSPDALKTRQQAWSHQATRRVRNIVPTHLKSCMICGSPGSSRTGIRNYGRLIRICKICALHIVDLHEHPWDPLPFKATH